MEPKRVTQSTQANEQLLYFTSSSLTSDDRQLVFISDRTGDVNLFVRDLATGTERLLTHNTEGMLKSYVYFNGSPYRGLGKASISLDPARHLVYYLQGREIRCADLNGSVRTLAEYPAGQMTAFTHISADGTRLCVPTTDARALDGDRLLPAKPDYDIDQRVREEKLNSYLRIYDTLSGKEIACEKVPCAWITHVQFSPIDRNLLLYNHEWPSDCGIRRMWLWDGARHLRLRTEGPGRSRNDWTCHEMWERDGQAIIYHGKYASDISYIGRLRPDGSDLIEVSLPADYTQYGHFTVGQPGMLVSDGCYRQGDADAEGWTGHWISLQRMSWSQGKIQWIPLCRHGSSWDSQDSHPHPIFNHAADTIYFTSDRDGKRAVWSIAAG